jgi:hypothetical protein
MVMQGWTKISLFISLWHHLLNMPKDNKMGMTQHNLSATEFTSLHMTWKIVRLLHKDSYEAIMARFPKIARRFPGKTPRGIFLRFLLRSC